MGTPDTTPGRQRDELVDLMRRIAEHQDQAAFAELFGVLAPKVKRFLLSQTRGDDVLAEELTQETLVRVWHKAQHYQPERGAVSTWVFGIARNLRIDQSRRKRPEVDESDPALVVDPNPGADAAASATERAERVRSALDDLPTDQLRVLRAAYFNGYSLPEIAEQDGVALGTVKSRVRLALGRLRGALGSLAP